MDLGSISPNISQTQTRGRTAVHLVAPTSRIQVILRVCAKRKTHSKRSYSFLEDHPHQGFCPFFTMKTMAFCPSADEDDGLLLKTMAIGLLLTRWMELGFVHDGRSIDGAWLLARWEIDRRILASRTMEDWSMELGFAHDGRSTLLLLETGMLRFPWLIAFSIYFLFIYFFVLDSLSVDEGIWLWLVWDDLEWNLRFGMTD